MKTLPVFISIIEPHTSTRFALSGLAIARFLMVYGPGDIKGWKIYVVRPKTREFHVIIFFKGMFGPRDHEIESFRFLRIPKKQFMHEIKSKDVGHTIPRSMRKLFKEVSKGGVKILLADWLC